METEETVNDHVETKCVRLVELDKTIDAALSMPVPTRRLPLRLRIRAMLFPEAFAHDLIQNTKRSIARRLEKLRESQV